MPCEIMEMRFPLGQIQYWANRYSFPRADAHLIAQNNVIQQQRYFTRGQLLELCRWKSPRAAPKAEINSEDFVKEVSRISLETENEELRIKVLTLLNGVSWPVASALLHFYVSNNYPILDVRALWSLRCEVRQHQYNFNLWSQYVNCCRATATEAGITIRLLDKALWQYSKEHHIINDAEG
ncbi:MAG: hypothetical protein Q8M34_02895 [Thermodesulfovibrionales bacterium]|nr:hypothetical protein [Thermodesulfovibrionales bacterium]